MVTEHALLPVVAGREAEFEAAFDDARSIVAASPGFVDLILSRCVERTSTYLPLVRWRTLADHEQGFRGSPAYQDWREALHRFYDPFPVVEHVELVTTA